MKFDMGNQPGSYNDLQTSWKALYYFNIYRLLLSGAFASLYWFDQFPEPLGIYNQTLFIQTSHIYLFFTLSFFYSISLRQFHFHLQVAIYALLDISFLTVLIYSSTGLHSGLGVLLIIAVAGNSILTTKKMAISIAALASLAVLTEEIYAEFTHSPPQTNYVHAGFLGITFFITSIIGQALALRTKKSEELARKRGIDLKNLSRLNELIVHRMQTGILVINNHNKIELCNQAMQKMLNTDNSQGCMLKEISPEIYQKFESWKNGRDKQYNNIYLRDSGINVQLTFSQLSIESIFAVLIFVEDVALLRQHVQQIKLTSLGTLAAGIAHEVRNPLGAISNASQLLSESICLNPEDKKLSAIIQQHSIRVNNVIENVMSISRREPSIPEEIDLHAWLKNFIEQLRTRQDLEKNDVRLTTDKHNLCVKMDSLQLDQILSNLCENALRYSKHKPSVELEYGIKQETEQPYLDVIDHGSGISDGIAERLFEPFFTSEPEGSGMGLYIARELCEANQADLSLYSNTDMGCCFRITFPPSPG